MEQHLETVRSDGVTQPMKYTVVIEKTPNNYAAYVPDLPGCVATANSREELLEEIREAIEFHIEGMREDGGTSSSISKVCAKTAKPSRNPRL